MKSALIATFATVALTEIRKGFERIILLDDLSGGQ
jgi:hypothetical protein